MNADVVMQIGRDALWIAALLSAPILLTALGIGLLIGVFQAATQIQEMTLSFIPKLIGVAAVLVLAGPWMLTLITEWVTELLLSIPLLLS
jgi:flagellar biosynthetic protein FliQ